MRRLFPALIVALVMTPIGARAADLVVWWDEGYYYAEEDAAIREVIAAFEQKAGKQVELALHPMEELPDDILAAFESGQPPDFAFGFWLDGYAEQWALEGRLVDLSDRGDNARRCHGLVMNQVLVGQAKGGDHR
jgi:ABC-type glycerol-3-phosphate transport system substrate-binding protein